MALESIPIRNPSDAARAAVALVPMPHSDLNALEATVYELCLNVVQWAQAPGSVLVERADDQMIITVQDDGVGIPATMRAVDHGLSNEEAVAAALRVGVTASGEPWRGFGLNSAVDLSRREGFCVHLASRDAAVWMADGTPVFSNKSGGSIAGTMVQIVVSLPSTKAVL